MNTNIRSLMPDDELFWICPICKATIATRALRCKECGAPMQGPAAQKKPSRVSLSSMRHPTARVGISFKVKIEDE